MFGEQMLVQMQRSLLGGKVNIVLLFLLTYLVCVSCKSMGDSGCRIVTKLDKPNVVTRSGLEVPDRYWGSYRSGDYFGLQTRHKESPVFGLMWFAQPATKEDLKLRFWCKLEDGFDRYHWLKHDGKNFGYQELVDGGVLIKTAFVKRPGGDYGGEWTARITAIAQDSNSSQVPMSFLFYTATNGAAKIEPHFKNPEHLEAISGEARALGNFSVEFSKINGTVIRYNYLQANIPPGLKDLEEIVTKHLNPSHNCSTDKVHLLELDGNVAQENANHRDQLLMHQVTFVPPYELEVVFKSHSCESRQSVLEKDAFEEELGQRIKTFDDRFEETFHLKGKGYDDAYIATAQATLSNMIGSVGYFYGQSLVQSNCTGEPVEYFPTELYTGVPSRSGFPRGFLWDEGFHNLLISRWDAEISKDILGHWLDLMNVDGWIPREQILGEEARTRVPSEFLVQRDTNGNPPTIILSFYTILDRMRKGEIPTDKDFLFRSFARLQHLFQWLNTTQVGKLPNSYYWKGRDPNNVYELIPQALASGMDDYPRASHPNDDERHLDLRCWIAHSAYVMKNIAQYLGISSPEFDETYDLLSNNSRLEELHWDTEAQAFHDFGNHTDNITLEYPDPNAVLPPDPYNDRKRIRVTWSEPTLKYIDTFGYVSLFPLFTQLLDADNPVLGKLLQDMRNRTLLWTDFGLRSVAPSSPFYMKYNADNEAPYWRAPIWININYMALKALKFYENTSGPYQSLAASVYKELRENVVRTMVTDYMNTGYIWEHYNDIDGSGEGNHPFTGWSATLVLMMAEEY